MYAACLLVMSRHVFLCTQLSSCLGNDRISFRYGVFFSVCLATNRLKKEIPENCLILAFSGIFRYWFSLQNFSASSNVSK